MARIGSANSLPRLGDFSTDRRVLILVAMAILVGVGGALAAWFLLRVIALATNLIWLHTLSVQNLPLAGVKRDAWMVAAPALGGLLIGLMRGSAPRKSAATAFPRRSRPS
jgi:H+/Cl- antiporter ClcA